MARAYSQDLRDLVIDAALGGMPAGRAAAQFEIGIAGAPGAHERGADGASSGSAAALQARLAARLPARSGRTDAGHDDRRDATAACYGARHQGERGHHLDLDTYRSATNERFLDKAGKVSRIHHKKPRGKPMPQDLFIRTIGIARAEATITLANMAYI